MVSRKKGEREVSTVYTWHKTSERGGRGRGRGKQEVSVKEVSQKAEDEVPSGLPVSVE